MADVLSKGTLFPEELIPEFVQKTVGASALAKLCGATPIPFNGLKEFTFQLDREVDVVAENGKKGKGGITVAPVTLIQHAVCVRIFADTAASNMAFVIAGIHDIGQTDLLEVSNTVGDSGAFTSCAQSGQQHGGKDSDDGNYHRKQYHVEIEI